ncbi:MAG: DJ-1/PfpI family protein [Desulfovibrionaceae bacterium]|nr:DJ-1/PfpI family protein [Desulfovibrionaceae bacterium]MBF0512903.1 DJ-1/PfpI family protein [Desulfovibrionaceae bacterium]
MERKRVGIVLFEDIEALDFCGPYEVFSVTRVREERRREEPSPYEVLLVAQNAGPVAVCGGMRVIAGYDFSTCPQLDVLVAPGGFGVRTQIGNPAMLDFLRRRAAEVETLASVCTGAMLLGFAGLLDGRAATTHWRSLQWMRESFPRVAVTGDRRVVEDGRLLTSAGISAGIDLALRIVARDYGDELARATAQHMEYPYPDANARRMAC